MQPLQARVAKRNAESNHPSAASVMSRSSAPVLAARPRLVLLVLAFWLLLLLLLIDASSAQTAVITADVGVCSPESCAALDLVALLREFASSLNDTAPPLPPSVDASDEESLLLLPFGALASDWTRLLLLQDRQPVGTALRDNLLRLSRLMLAAYFHGQDEELRRWDARSRAHSDDNRQHEGHATIISSGGGSSSSGNSTTVSETESEDQQANNVTLGSTAQKGSTWINASSSGAYNNEKEQPTSGSAGRAGNFPGSAEDDSTAPTSYYESSSSLLPPLAANFNRAFSSPPAADNEPSGSKSNETLATGARDNEDESTETWFAVDSFASSSPPPDHRHQLRGDKSLGEITATDDFTSTITIGSSGSSENSRANEAIHERSKEDFLASRYASKENDKDAVDEDDDLVAKFFASDEAAAASYTGHGSLEDLLALMELEELEAAERANNKSADLAHSGETTERLTQSIEDFFNDDNDSLVGRAEPRGDSSAGSAEASLEFNTTKSIEDFFDSEERRRPSAEVGTKLDIKSRADGEEILPPNFASEVAKNMTREVGSAVLEAGGDSNESSTFAEAIVGEAASEASLVSSAELDALEATTTRTMLILGASTPARNDSLDFDELVQSEELDALLDAVSAESSSGGGGNEDAPTTLIHLITGRFSPESGYSNEITPTLEATTTTSAANGTEDRSAKYPNATTATATTLAPSVAGNTTLEKANAASSENRTSDREDDLLFRETGTSGDDWSSTSSSAWIVEDETSRGASASPEHHQSRKILTTFRHEASASANPTANKLTEPEALSPWTEDDTWELKEGALNPAAAAPSSRSIGNGIAIGARMNKRKTRKRAGAELADVERQYRTFFGNGPGGSEPGQTQFAEKRPDEEDARLPRH